MIRKGVPPAGRAAVSSPVARELIQNNQIILKHVADGIAVIVGDRLAYCSPRLVTLSGYSERRLKRRNLIDFIHPDDRQAFTQHVARVAKGKRSSAQMTLTVINGKGQIRGVASRFLRITWSGKPAVLAIITDQTKQIRTEQSLKRQLRERDLLQAISTLSIQAKQTHSLLRQVTRLLSQFYACTECGAILLSDAQQVLLPHPTYHLGKQRSRLLQKADEGVVGWVIQNGRPQRIGDVRGNSRYLTSNPNTRSELCLPLRMGHRTIGAINIETGTLNAFSLEDEKLVGTIANLLSIAIERLNTEAELRSSENRFRLLFEQSRDPVFLCGPDSRIIDCNRQATELLGFSRDELIGMTYKQLVDREYHDDSRRKLLTIKQGIDIPPYEKILVAKDGHRIPIMLTPHPVFDSKGKMLWFQSVIRDIREKKEAERLQSALYRISEVSNSTRDLDHLFKAIHGIIAELMVAKNIFIALHERDSDLIRFPYFIDLYSAPPKPQKPGKGLVSYILRTGEPLLANRRQLLEMQKSGELQLNGETPVDWLGVPLKGYDGAIIGVLSVQTYDPSVRYSKKEKNILMFVSQQIATAIERKASEEEVREAEIRFQQFEKMETIGTLVSSITHDFNNILTSVMGNAEFLEYKLQDIHPELSRYLHSILQASKSGTGLLQQLLSYSKKEEPQLDTVDLNGIIDEWSEILLRVVGDRITLQTNLAPDLPTLRANRERTKQVLMNLVVNARDAMPGGGAIVILTDRIDWKAKRMYRGHSLQGRHYVRLTVKDTGQGMDNQTLAKVFDPFFTTKKQGTGLGLTIVKRIVDQMAGFITLQSKRGSGTAVSIYIPGGGRTLDSQPAPSLRR